jgi:ABC-type uncharacterized transport system fused permease/ATPase subunit
MDKEQNTTPDSNIQSLRKSVKWLAIGASIVLGFVYLIWLVWSFNNDEIFIEIMYQHLAMVAGIPGAIITAFVLVSVLEQVSGQIKFEGLGFRFEGASGPIIMWVVVFCALVGGIKLLW